MNIHGTLFQPYHIVPAPINGLGMFEKKDSTVDFLSYTLHIYVSVCLSQFVCKYLFTHSLVYFFRVGQDSPYLLEDPILNAIAKKHSRSPGQIALRYLLQRGMVVLAKSFSEKRIKENFEVKVQEHLFRVRHGD
jgi:hypothetical protein